MQIKKQALLDAIKTALDNYEAAEKKYQTDYAKWKQAQVDKWFTDHADEWGAALTKARRALSSKKPITASMFPNDGRGYSDSIEFWRGTPNAKDKPREPRVIPIERLESLRGALNAIEEDILSERQIQLLGFKNVEWLFRAAVANGGTL